MGTSRVSELIDFTGGMNTLVAPHLISITEAKSLINVDIRLGTLQSMPGLDHLEQLSGQYFIEFNGEVYSYDNYRYNVIWDNKLYWTDGVNSGKVLTDGTELPLGISTPTDALAQSDGGEGPLTGDYKYTYTFYSSTTGVESAPAPLPNHFEVEDKAITLTGFQDPIPDGADMYRLYRVGGYLPQFLLVDTFDVTTYTDTLDDTKIDGRLLHTLRSSPPPGGLVNLLELNGRFYGSIGNKLYYSALGNPDAWYVSDYFATRDTVIALAAVPAGLLVLGKNYVNLLYGTQPNNFKLKLISDQLGCVSAKSLAHVGDSVIWLSNTQLVMSNGYKITDITSYKIDRMIGLDPTGCVVDNETYYLVYKPSLYPDDLLFPSDTLFPDTTQGTSVIDQGIIALDFKRGRNFSYKIIDYRDVRSIGIIRGGVAVSTGEYNTTPFTCEDVMFPDCDGYIQCSQFSLSSMNVYNDQGLATLHYVSPKLTDGSRATLKEYDKVRVLFKGTFNVKVILNNNKLVLDRDIDSDIKGELAVLGIPNKENKGYHITFVVEGIGVIESIQYSWKPRELVN